MSLWSLLPPRIVSRHVENRVPGPKVNGSFQDLSLAARSGRRISPGNPTVASNPVAMAFHRITREVLGVCVRKGDTALRDAINAALVALTKDGTLAALIRQWLGDGATAPS